MIQMQLAVTPLRIFNSSSIAENTEYGGTIEREVTPVLDANGDPVLNADGSAQETVQYYATDAVAGDGDSVSVNGSRSTTVGQYHTHGDYSKVGPNGDPVRVDPSLSQSDRKAQDQYDSDNFSTGPGGDTNTAAAIAAATAPARAKYGETYRSYLGTPSGQPKVYTPPQ